MTKPSKKRIKNAFLNDAAKIANMSGINSSDVLDFLKYQGQGLMCNRGYILFEMRDRYTHIFDIFVTETRNTFGTQLVDRLEKKSIENGVRTFLCSVPEKNLAAQLFFKSLGYQCVKIACTNIGTFYEFEKNL